ncbi:hypothetical protein HG535_0G00260 [Zygotorulaspora mrakii]|uniref:Glucose-signaling factor 2 n=1 Tax=Zygotorulaspora mrakii TaxID=42260 RepID=A0A7H9B651_ZYGMR|nr:uncharacterized protein HG535_0G00260 [Zygotorulaspora mrakii]QLG74141.1 hypothetical protein HG535_0G00260 [Zygotorulaspora mrakii]
MELYVRFNEDVERDFAFQVEAEDTIETKINRAFREGEEGLADLIVLRPSIFYEKQPIGYFKSMHPGYFTEGGCLIFDYDSDLKQFKQRLDYEKPLIDQLWPGQLVLPQWKKCRKNIAIYTLIMLLWLYTDLPDVVSPTPGNCFTNQLSRLAIPLFDRFDLPHIADKLREETSINFSSVLAQWAFFGLHILKIGLITLFVVTGMANPISFNPIKLWKIRNVELTDPSLKKKLRALGWIGSRRATYDDYQQNFYSYIMKKFGSPTKAYKAGMLRVAAAPGLRLREGEGFQTPLQERFSGSTVKKMEEEGKFILSEEYFVQLEKDLKENLDKCKGDIGEMNNEIRRFRRCGLYEPGETLQKLVKLRKEAAAKEKEQEQETSKETKKEK